MVEWFFDVCDMYKLDINTNIWENVNPVLSIPEIRYNVGSTVMDDAPLHKYFVIYGGAKTNLRQTTDNTWKLNLNFMNDWCFTQSSTEVIL